MGSGINKSLLEQIAQRLDVFDTLSACGVDHTGKTRIPCPVHGGDGLNFAIHDNGRRWTCHSRHCGTGRMRDAVNLFCLIRYGNPLPDLDAHAKAEAMRELCRLAGIDDRLPVMPRRPSSRWDRIPEPELQALSLIFADTSRLARFGHVCLYTAREVINAVLYLSLARSAGKLPRQITHDWPEYGKLVQFMTGTK